ncbi:MAG TPA: bifunctional methylenetetrahydrofolate dehydrogenase/methenyltetrahydrofolate cyclohydrolase FolD [Alphaproteobacteria bacterium]|nr:bifunctional methylenetetrahydrofolate dehydrogenase/methenyltetrahydrofolate cyclohydrolase FolD [Alphaproteobacteria bacterium]USO04752.1 MAG: bifunctional methylenetetrahydrofolate dehydrogenase/methenyltetrahydrofolate cyclohydrolase FolD [Rhodospirillales bacterium]HOO81264.1 bifunctional methylenetetrahydrofolate dehydrogenase/methenyltetrahydrofolate cyclohydrolase FolD [Alphaproteobacteria bacterium]
MSETQNIDGKAVAKTLREELADEVAGLNIQPGLAVILVGEDPASQVYVHNKIKACEACGIKSFESRLPAQATEAEIMAEIEAFNDNKDVHGILLQLPLPYPLNADVLIQHIKPEKDVDGLTFINQGKLIAGDKSGLVPCTPQGSMMLIKSVEEDLSGKHAVVIGRSLLFGKPMAQLLLAENCTVTSAHSRTQNLPEICQQADILVAAVGRPKMVQGAWIKPGAIVIDVGINRQDDGKLCGDVDYEQARGVASAITPVPGGVGPMTIACLLKNTVEAAKKAKN